MVSVNDWYSNFLARRCIPIKRELPLTAPNDGFALVIEALHFTKLVSTAKYRISCFFFDSKTCQLFGSPYHGPWNFPDHHDCFFHDTIFFHCPRLDEAIQLIIEVVCDTQESNEKLQTIAWAPISIAGFYETVPEYARLPKELPLTKLKLHPGTPKVLTFTNNFNSETTVGILDCVLCVHPPLVEAFDFFPDFCIVGEKEHIPGLVQNSNMGQLSFPKKMRTIPAVLEDIGLSFGPHAEKIEKLILDDMKSDRLYRENHNPGTFLQPMQVLERRLRISIHNGYTFLFEPLVVHLSSVDEIAMGTHSLRRKGRPLSRSSSDIRTEINTLFVRSKVTLPALVDHPKMVIVFALDYLIGTRNKQGNKGGDSQSVVIGWGAWKPDRKRSDVHASVALIGGPRPNPEESLCFKNLLHLYRKDDSMFTESAPKISINFLFSTEEGRRNMELGRSIPSGRLDDVGRGSTPAPSREPEMISPAESERERVQEDEYDQGPLVLPPVEKPKIESARSQSARSRIFEERYDHLIENEPESPRDDLVSTYSIPWKETRMTNISRSVISSLTKIPFAQILDRHGEPPPQVDVSGSLNTIELSVEAHDRLITNEIVLQFLAFKWLDKQDASQPQKLFFTTQFYRFPLMTTEELYLPDSNNNGEPNILMRADSEGKEGNGEPGFTAKFIVDRPAGLEEKEFVKFLQFGHLFIDVWDARSLVLLGTCIVNLRTLLRQGQEAVSMAVQCPVVFSALYLEKRMSGLLFMKMACIGHPSSNQIDMVNSRTTAVVSRRLCTVGEEGPDSYRILAKPLTTTSDNALQRFLQAQRIDIQERYEELFNEESHKKLREWEKLKSAVPNSTQKNELKRFIFDEQLEAYRKLRYESKASKLLQAVFRGITTQHQVFPGLGEQNFFEFMLENPFAEPVNCVIEMDCPDLEIVFDTETWAFYKRVNALQTPMEKDLIRMIKKDKAEIFLRAHESVYVPFLYTYNAATPTSQSPAETKVLFRRWDDGQPLAILDLHIHKRPPIVNRTIRVYHASNTQCIRDIVIDSLPEGRRAASIRTSDPTARVEIRSRGAGQDLIVNMFCGDPGSSRSILILLYGDTRCYRLLSVFHFVVHSVERVEIRSTLGQTIRFNIGLIRREPGNQLLEICSENSSLKPYVGDAPILATAPQVTLPMLFTPQAIGRQQAIVTAVDAGSRQLLHAWLIVSKTAQPTITRRYEMRVPLRIEHVIAKKLPVHNPYSIRREFRMSSSRPELIQFEKESMALEAGQTSSINVFFLNVVQKPVCIEILIFFQNKETDQTEDTFALSVTYE